MLPGVAPRYSCETCDYTTSKTSSWLKHVKTIKHLGLSKQYTCVCGCSYAYQSGLLRHKRVCSVGAVPPSFLKSSTEKTEQPTVAQSNHTIVIVPQTSNLRLESLYKSVRKNLSQMKSFDGDVTKYSCNSGAGGDDDSYDNISDEGDSDKHGLSEITSINIGDTTVSYDSISCDDNLPVSELKGMFMTVMKENQELRNIIMEQTKQSVERENKLMELAQRPSTTTNNNIINNNQRVNILNYLNTECKDAISLTEFMDSIELSMDDMYYTRDNGYVKGICNVINREFGALSQSERPIHCTDKKRLKFFVKGKIKWEKDEDHSQLNCVVDNITEKHRLLLAQWKEMHPNWLSEEALQNEYLLLTSQIFNGGTANGEKNRKAIVKNLSETTEVVPMPIQSSNE